MLLRLALSFLAFGLLRVTNALHASEAGIVDWHNPLIGVPLSFSHSLSPSLHRYGSGRNRLSTRSVLLTATNANILAAVNPDGGGLVWRYAFDADDPIVSYKAHQDFVSVLSGPGGSMFRTFDVTNGHLLSEKRLHTPVAGRLFEPVDLGVHLSFANRPNLTISSSSEDVFVLTDGYNVRRIGAVSGEIKWEWSSEDQTSLVVYSRLARTADAVYAVGLSKSLVSYQLHIQALSPTTGEVLSHTQVPSNIHNGLTDFLVLSNVTSGKVAPNVVWLEKGAMRHIMLTPSLNTKSMIIKGVKYKTIFNIGLNEHGYFVALKDDGTARVLHLDEQGTRVNPFFEYPESETSKDYTDSLYAGGFDKDGVPHIGRVYWSHILHTGGAQIFSPLASRGKGMVTGFTFPFSTNSHGIIDNLAFDAAQLSESTVIGRFILTTGTGALQLWQQDKVQWTREEALSEIKLATMVELPEKATVASHVNVDNETMSGRISRQLSDAKDFPKYFVNFIKRFATGSYASVSTSAAADADSSGALYRDEFGFRKIIVVATSRGIIYGINSGNGAILWSRILGLGYAAESGGRHLPVKIFVTQTVSDGESPRVAILTQRFAGNSLVDTVVFHVEVLTGEDVQGLSSRKDLLKGVDALPGEIVDAYMLSDSRTIVMVDKFLQIYLYPDNSASAKAFEKVVSKLHFPLKSADRILGHLISPKPDVQLNRYLAYPFWTLALPAGEKVLDPFFPPSEPVASFGKVLGDRRTLYKYLNPAVMGFTTISTVSDTPTCGVYVVDAGKGSVLYHAVLPSENGKCAVKATMAENWLIYTYYDEETGSAVQAKGYRIVSVEFYEGKEANDKTRSQEASVFANGSSNIHYYEQAFVFPHEVMAMTTSTTKFGIATKDLIIANKRGQIQTFPRRMFDPRRPKRKPTTEEQQEEWLVQYEPLIPDDPRRVISHNYKLVKITDIITSPALLESTSLVFGYGLDLFSSRIAPSSTFDVLSENFNKVQLVLTVCALAAAIVVTKPMVERKRLREKWYY